MIQIYNGTLTSKERVLRTFNHEKADRVPIGYFANPGIQKRVAAALGVPADKDSVNDALGVDFKGLMPAYTGKPLFTRRGRSAMSTRSPEPSRAGWRTRTAATGTTVISAGGSRRRDHRKLARAGPGRFRL
mgnify:CR=1 FL=1